LLALPRPPRSTLFPYTTLFRSLPRVLVGVDLVEALDRGPVRLRMRAEDALDHAAARVEQHVHRALQAAHRRDLVDVRAHRAGVRSEEHTSELQSLAYLVCRLLL